MAKKEPSGLEEEERGDTVNKTVALFFLRGKTIKLEISVTKVGDSQSSLLCFPIFSHASLFSVSDWPLPPPRLCNELCELSISFVHIIIRDEHR